MSRGTSYLISSALVSVSLFSSITARVNEIFVKLSNRITSIFIYKALKDGEIRVINLHKGSPNDPIVCTLFTKPLSSPGHYDALSYVWGSWNNPDRISLNEKSFYITRNLADALKRLRRFNSDRLVWADALSINQADNTERGKQVRQMHKVYGAAKLVQVWLGGHSNDSDWAMKLVEKSEGQPSPLDWIQDVINEHSVEKVANALFRICLRDYWERVWIVQEIANASEVILMCGTHEASFASFKQLVALVQRHKFIQHLPDTVTKKAFLIGLPLRILHIPNCNKEKGETSLLDIGDVSAITRIRKCKDPRDKLFGVISLLQEDIYKELEKLVSYKRSDSHTFTSAAISIIKTTGRLESITWQASPYSRKRHWYWKQMPSWAMDWALPGFMTPYSRDDRFHADGVSTAHGFSFENKKLLLVNGVRLGTILQTVHGVGLGDSHLDRTVPFHSVVEKTQEYHDTILKIGKFDYMALAQTVIGGVADGREGQMPWENIMKLIYTTIAGGGQEIINLLTANEDIALGQQFSDEIMKMFVILKPEWGYHMQSKGKIPTIEQEDKGHTPKLQPPIVTMAMANGSPKKGDIICVLRGCRAPVILRRVWKHYQVIGDAYVYGFMRGEALIDVSEDKFEQFSLC